LPLAGSPTIPTTSLRPASGMEPSNNGRCTCIRERADEHATHATSPKNEKWAREREKTGQGLRTWLKAVCVHVSGQGLATRHLRGPSLQPAYPRQHLPLALFQRPNRFKSGNPSGRKTGLQLPSSCYDAERAVGHESCSFTKRCARVCVEGECVPTPFSTDQPSPMLWYVGHNTT
jgi:hypothetical protein